MTISKDYLLYFIKKEKSKHFNYVNSENIHFDNEDIDKNCLPRIITWYNYLFLFWNSLIEFFWYIK